MQRLLPASVSLLALVLYVASLISHRGILSSGVEYWSFRGGYHHYSIRGAVGDVVFHAIFLLAVNAAIWYAQSGDCSTQTKYQLVISGWIVIILSLSFAVCSLCLPWPGT